MNHRLPKKIRHVQKLRVTTRKAIVVGVSISILTIMLIVYFQLFENETVQAEKSIILTQDELPVSLEIETPVITSADTNNREGVRFKIAKQITVGNE